MVKFSLLAVFILMPLGSVAAQQAPDAGQQIQQIPKPPIVERPAPEIKFDRPTALVQPAVAGPKVRVNALLVTGETLFS